MSAAEASGGIPEGAPGPRRPPWTTFRAALDELGFHPSRKLGQNFLLDDTLVEAIARDAGVSPGELVVEVGPGCGFLSVHLAALGVRLLAVEIDRRLFQVASRFLEPWPDAEVLRADVLAGKHALAPELEERLEGEPRFHLVANLPYAVSAPVLALLAGRDEPPLSMTVLVQKEVGERMVAEPGTGDWGPLSVSLQLAYEGRILRTVGPGSFWPRPRVDSVVVRLERRRDAAPGVERRALASRVRQLLQRRRQSLGRVVGDLLGDREAGRALLARLELDTNLRAEVLGLDHLLQLHEGMLAAAGELPGEASSDQDRG